MAGGGTIRPSALATVVAVTATPFDASGGIAAKAMERVVDRLVEGGISVLVPAGNTGEFNALSQAEWDESVAITVERANGAVVMPGVGRDLATAIHQTRRARELGCAVVMVHQPLDPFISGEGWINYHEAIHQAVPDIALCAYVRDVRRSVEEVARLAGLEGVVGIKYAVGDPPAFADLVQRSDPDKVALVCGLAERWAVSFAASGAVGFTSGLAGVVPKLSLELLGALEAGDYARARELVGLVEPFERLRARDGSAYNVSAVKEALAQLDICAPTVRPPASVLPEEFRSIVSRFIEATGATA